MVKEDDRDVCGVCGRVRGEYTAVHYGFSETPFMDGRYYSMVCFTCCCVRRQFCSIPYDIETDCYAQPYTPLKTVAEMMEDGWDRHEAERSIKAVQRLMKKPQLTVENDGEMILDKLFLPDVPLQLA